MLSLQRKTSETFTISNTKSGCLAFQMGNGCKSRLESNKHYIQVFMNKRKARKLWTVNQHPFLSYQRNFVAMESGLLILRTDYKEYDFAFSILCHICSSEGNSVTLFVDDDDEKSIHFGPILRNTSNSIVQNPLQGVYSLWLPII